MFIIPATSHAYILGNSVRAQLPKSSYFVRAIAKVHEALHLIYPTPRKPPPIILREESANCIKASNLSLLIQR